MAMSARIVLQSVAASSREYRKTRALAIHEQVILTAIAGKKSDQTLKSGIFESEIEERLLIPEMTACIKQKSTIQ